MKKWKCTICGYIHEGNEPPDKCPVCGADKEKFIELTEESVESKKNNKTNTQTPKNTFQRIDQLMIKHHVHPVSIHFPNGILPAAGIFIFLAVCLNLSQLSQAAFYNLVVVLFSIPLVMYSGYNEWKNKYHGKLTRLFLIKIICAIVVVITLMILVCWHIVAPDVYKTDSKWMYLFVYLVMLASAGASGYIGGKLVFKD